MSGKDACGGELESEGYVIAITVVDSIMGSGKTSAMINKVNTDMENNYIYVTPYLPEVERYIEKTEHRFRQPLNTGDGKLDYLHRLLAAGENIATTHALFLMATAETIQFIHEGGYTLILDEVLEVFKEYNDVVKALDDKTVNKGDVRWLQQEGYISVSPDDYSVHWSGSATDDFHYSEIERLSKNGNLRCIDDVLYWEYSTEVFNAFKDIYILTYLFQSTMLSSYMDIYGFSYARMSAKLVGDGNYHLCQYSDSIEDRRALAPYINIYDGELNRLGYRTNSFSVNWLKGRNAEQVKVIKNAMRSYKGQVGAATNSVIWTTTKKDDFYKKLEKAKGFKYIRQLSADEQRLLEDAKRKLQCFVACKARATNDFSNRTTLLYLINRYLPPEIEKYFSRRGSPINEDLFATSELLQWIWRNAIRNRQKVNLYIPSSRMRKLLTVWLGIDEVPYLPRTRGALKTALL